MWFLLAGIAGLIALGSRNRNVRHWEAHREAKIMNDARGIVLPLDTRQTINRALYLAQLVDSSSLDGFINLPASLKCPDIYYRLKDYNGGKNPKAPHPATVWYEKDANGVNHERRTCDCIGGASWIGGWDRFQPNRFSHLYGGWINTDSMLMDARGPKKCFVELPAPVPGCYIVCASGSPGHAVGHIGTVISVPEYWNPSDRNCWAALKVVEVASRSPHIANGVTTGRGWYGTNAGFVVSVMK